MSKKIIIFAVAGLLLGGGGAAAWFFMQSDEKEAEAPVEMKPALLNMDVFLTNIRSTRGEHHARLEVKLALTPPERADEIKGDELLMARLRDQVLSQLTSESFEDLQAPEGKERFRDELRNRLTPLIEEGELKEVLFSDFVVQ